MSASDKKKRGLGKGLEALLADAEGYRNTPNPEIAESFVSDFSFPVKDAAHFVFIPLENISPNPINPRRDFNQEALEELAKSIAQHGVIQPITVRPILDGKYEIISGERRYRASKLAGLKEIPAYLRLDQNDFNTSTLELALIENIQREDLNAIEIALSYQRLLEECHWNQEQLSERVAKKRSTVTNYLRLLKLCPEIQAAVRDHQLSMGHAKALLSLEDQPDQQLALFALILERGLSVRETENLARQQDHITEDNVENMMIKTQTITKNNVKNSMVVNPEEIEHIQHQLSLLFDLKVSIKQGQKGDGKITIHFDSLDQVQKVMQNFVF